MDWEVWALCIDGEGNVIRDPNEILHNWTLEQVMTAWDLKMIAQERAEKLRRERQAQKNART